MPPKILSINISEGVVLPSKEEKEIIVFKPDEQLAIIEAARKNRLGFAIGKPGRMCAAIAKGPLGGKLHDLARQG